MKVRLINQPFQGALSAYDVLREWFDDPRVTTIDVCVAWAKRSGLQLIKESAALYRKRGGRLNLIVGIDAGGATRQGLQLAFEMADSCSIFHVGSSRTFHPKLYIGYGKGVARVMLGSQNATRGGLVENFEVGVELALDMDNEGDCDLFNQVLRVKDGYSDAGKAFRVLSSQSLRQILDDPRYRIGDEALHENAWGNGNSSSGKEYGFVYQGSRLRRAYSGVSEPKPRPPERNSALDTPPRLSAAADVRWFKKASAADAQHPAGANTNPTGHLTLVQARHPIDHASWFREVLFRDLAWSEARGKEMATLSMRVFFGGQDLGLRGFSVTHKPSFVAGQGNRATVLHWGDLLDLIKENDISGKTVTIERDQLNEYTLSIGDEPAGPFKG